MWGFEASALAFIQFSGTLASTRELIAEAGVSGEVTGNSERLLSSHSCVSFLIGVVVFWVKFQCKTPFAPRCISLPSLPQQRLGSCPRVPEPVQPKLGSSVWVSTH